MRKYLDTHPRDVAATRALKKLVERRYKKNVWRPSKRKLPKRHTPLRLLKQYERDYLERTLGRNWGLMPKSTILRVLRRINMKGNPRARWYVGIKGPGKFIVFSSSRKPTQSTHGHLYNAVVGPFKDKRSAEVYRNRLLPI